MITRTKLVLPLLLAAGLLFTNLSCKKSANDTGAMVENSDMVTVSGRTATGTTVAVQMPRALAQQARAGQRIQLQQIDNGGFKGVQAAAATSRPDPSGVELGEPTECPPVPQEVLDRFQQEANDCCCAYAVCLLGEDCYFYFYYFFPNNGCTGGM